MKYRKLGNTSLMVSEISLGCSGFWGDKHFSDKKAIDVVLTAFDQGINLFDTGSNYSNFNAEPRLGRAVKEILKTHPRDRIVISTKAGSQSGYAPTVKDDDTRGSDYSADAIERSCRRSIENLGCGYIDIFQLHGFDRSKFDCELTDRLLRMKQDGLIRHIGVNAHFLSDLEFILARRDIFEMVLIDCNVLQLDRFDIIDRLSAAGIGVVVGTVLAQGHLVSRKIGSISNGSFFWYLARTLIKPTTRDFHRIAPGMRNLLSKVPEATAAQAAFAYMLTNLSISSCVFGTSSINNLLDVVQAPEKQLSESTPSAIRSQYKKHPSLSR
jgi:aryl-alcohol dehydrogenase-like predicted oxidoreductase